MALVPLTHHEILSLVEPFARRGRRVDLARTDRLARRLVFQPREHAADGTGVARRETLELDDATPGVLRLTRTLAAADGLQATLWTDGDDLAAMLARIDAVPHARQLTATDGLVVARDHRVDADDRLHFVGGSASVAGLELRMRTATQGGRRADVFLTTRLDDPIELPEDLLGVLGWDWSRLDRWTERTARRWTASVGLRRRDAEADAERKLERTARHLATTLGEAPYRFDERMRVARWGFAFRRAIPLLVCIALIVASLVFTKAGLSEDSVVRMLIFNAPPLMLVAFFCLREMPRIEWPRWPRRSTAAAWRPVPSEAVRAPVVEPRHDRETLA